MQVESIGDVYMGVCGAPVQTSYHAVYVCDLAVDLLQESKDVPDPSAGPGSNIRMKIGETPGYILLFVRIVVGFHH